MGALEPPVDEPAKAEHRQGDERERYERVEGEEGEIPTIAASENEIMITASAAMRTPMLHERRTASRSFVAWAMRSPVECST